jgi:prolyl-tRNA synthetase
VATGKDAAVFETAEALAGDLTAAGLDVLLDDRPRVSAGVKFADAELLGVPVVVVVGRSLAQGVVEVRRRRDDAREEVAPAGAVASVRAMLAGG